MKLFLSSMTISQLQRKYFNALVGKTKPQDITLAVVENAADVYADDNKAWVYQSRNSMQEYGYKVDVIDLRDYFNKNTDLRERLQNADAIWLGGGNTYYLRWILRETGADEVIVQLVKEGKVYGGGSAGAIVAGPIIKGFESADSPEEAPAVIDEGLKLTDLIVVPHWQNEKYGSIMEVINSKLKHDNFDTITITDEQALVIDGDTREIIPN